MARRVTVIASGDTERRALPKLVAQLESAGVALVAVRKPPHGKISGPIACNMIKADWYASPPSERPDKFVVLVDTDGRMPEPVLAAIREPLEHLVDVTVPKLVAPATWHLESWFFADLAGLRAYLGRAPSVPTERPDEIQDPKRCLKDLLRGNELSYTARVAEQIAATLSVERIRTKSPSWSLFEAALRNGSPAA